MKSLEPFRRHSHAKEHKRKGLRMIHKENEGLRIIGGGFRAKMLKTRIAKQG
jgi:hypothetical protein